jgi:hypothetical protein
MLRDEAHCWAPFALQAERAIGMPLKHYYSKGLYSKDLLNLSLVVWPERPICRTRCSPGAVEAWKSALIELSF